MTVQTAIPTVNANTPFIQNVPNSYVNQAWYQMLVALAQQAGGFSPSIVPNDAIQAEAYTARSPQRDPSAELLARLDSLEAQVKRLRGELAETRQALEYAETQKTRTASSALSASAIGPQTEYLFLPTTTTPGLGYLPSSGVVYLEGGSAVSVLQTNGGIALSAPIKWGITGSTTLGYAAGTGLQYSVSGTPVITLANNGSITATNGITAGGILTFDAAGAAKLGYLPGSGLVYQNSSTAVSVLQTNGGIALSAPVTWGISGNTQLGYAAGYGMEYIVGGVPQIYFRDNGGLTLNNALGFTASTPTYASASLGGAVLPATPLGFMGMYINGSLVKFPYYNP